MDNLLKTPEHEAFYEAVGILLIEVMRRFPRDDQYAILRRISSMATKEGIVIGDKHLEQLAREFYEGENKSPSLH